MRGHPVQHPPSMDWETSLRPHLYWSVGFRLFPCCLHLPSAPNAKAPGTHVLMSQLGWGERHRLEAQEPCPEWAMQG